MRLNAETPPPPPSKRRGGGSPRNSLMQFFQRPLSSSASSASSTSFRYPSPAASTPPSPAPRHHQHQQVYHPLAYQQQPLHSYTPPMTRAASVPVTPQSRYQGRGIPLSRASTASPVAPTRGMSSSVVYGGTYGTPSPSSVSSFDYYPQQVQQHHMYASPQRQPTPLHYEQQQHGQWMNSAYSLPMGSPHQQQQYQPFQQPFNSASSLSLYDAPVNAPSKTVIGSVVAPVPQPALSQTEAFLRLEIPSRDILLEEAARDVLISPLSEVMQIVHCNEANVSPVMFSPGLPRYKPLYAWEIDPNVPLYDYKMHSEMTLKVDKDLPPLQLVSPVPVVESMDKPVAKEESSDASLAELYVSLSDIQLESFEDDRNTMQYAQEPYVETPRPESFILRSLSTVTVEESIQDSGVSLSSFNVCEDRVDDRIAEELTQEKESEPPTPLPKSPSNEQEEANSIPALSLDTASALSVNAVPVTSPFGEFDTQSFVSCPESVNPSLLPPAESPDDFYYPYPLDNNGEPMNIIQQTLARVPSPATSSRKFSTDSGSTGSGSTVSEDTTMNRSSTLSVVEDGYRPSFLTLRKRQHALATSQVGEGAKIVPFEHTVDMYRRNCQKTNDPEIQFEFAQFCIKAGDRYIDEGLSWLKKLSQSGFSKAQYFLGLAYADDGRYDLAFRQFLQAAKRSHIESTYEVAKLSENGAKGISRNKKRALEYFTKAASAGHAKAMYRLALAELHGELGLRVNAQNAMKWLDRGASVANEDCPEPVFELSLIYETGMSPFLLADLYHSRTLLIEAAELQYAPALYKLATCFESGINGFPVNLNESIKLYRISSNSGYAPSQLAYAGWLLTGLEGVLEKNTEEAFYWAYQAAAQKHARAEYTVGYFLELGVGLAPDMAKALRWYVAAAKRGDELAIKRLKELNVSVPVDTAAFASSESHKKRSLFGFNIRS